MKEIINGKKYDLEERTAQFAEEVIDFCKLLEKSIISNSVIMQLIRSATSIGANYAEANSASSKKDFRNKIFICKKESQETRHWLRMLARCVSGDRERLGYLNKECQELILIFGKIVSKLRN